MDEIQTTIDQQKLDETFDETLEARIERLLASPDHAAHPLGVALAEIYARYQAQIEQMERLTSISDGYQTLLQTRNQTLSQRYDRQMRQLKKIVRISDQYQEMLRELNEAFKIASTRDTLTGLANRRLILECLENETEVAEKQNLAFCLALIDVDHFKEINDQFGHDMGDQVLVQIATTLSENLRGSDVCARWGGEEFLVLLPEAESRAGFETAQRLLKAIENMAPETWGGQTRLTLSIGVAQYRPGEPFAETIKRADTALYEAKNSGRNQIKIAE